MSLIPHLTLEELTRKIRNGETIRSSEIFIQGNPEPEYVGTFIAPSMLGGATIFDEIRTHAEYLGVRGNIVIPPDVKKDDVIQCDQCEFTTKTPIALIGHKRKHLVKV